MDRVKLMPTGIDKPRKKDDRELLSLLEEKIRKGKYVFLNHAKQRLTDRSVIDIEVLDILEGKSGRRRRRNKSKDKYEEGYSDWNYCIEGYNSDDVKIRVIFSFDDEHMLVITIIRI